MTSERVADEQPGSHVPNRANSAPGPLPRHLQCSRVRPALPCWATCPQIPEVKRRLPSQLCPQCQLLRDCAGPVRWPGGSVGAGLERGWTGRNCIASPHTRSFWATLA